MKCKFALSQACNSSLQNELHKQEQAFDELSMRVLPSLQNQHIPDHQQVGKRILEAHRLMHYHENTVVDLCPSDDNCKRCLQFNVNCLYSEEEQRQNAYCNTPVEWRIIGYRPRKVEPCEKLVKPIANVIRMFNSEHNVHKEGKYFRTSSFESYFQNSSNSEELHITFNR